MSRTFSVIWLGAALALSAVLLGSWALRNREGARTEARSNQSKALAEPRAPSSGLLRESERPIDFEALLEQHSQAGMAAILAALRKSETETRLKAVEALQEVGGPAAVDILGMALADPDPSVKRQAVEALADHDEPGVTPLLVQALDDPNPELRLEVLDALTDRGEEGLRAIGGALADRDPRVQARARELLDLTAEQEAEAEDD